MRPPQFLTTLARNTPTLAPVPHRGVLSIVGSQAPDLLNGLLATSVRQTRPLYSSFLHAQGRVLYDVFLFTSTRPGGKRGYLLDYDARPSDTPPLLEYLKRHVLRSRVKIRDVSNEYNVWASWGLGAKDHNWETKRQWNWSRSGAIEPVWDIDAADWPWGIQDGVILDRRVPGMGRRLLVRNGDKPEDASTHDIAPSDDYVLHRILHGVPEGSVDIPAMQAFPMDSNLDIMGAVDFRKGCYVGQELSVRTYHTGVIRKRILPVVLHDPNQKLEDMTALPQTNLPPYSSIHGSALSTTPKPRGTGKLLTSVQGVGLALLRLEQIAALQKGNLKLELESSSGEKAWAISPWWPDWWPHQPLLE